MMKQSTYDKGLAFLADYWHRMQPNQITAGIIKDLRSDFKVAKRILEFKDEPYEPEVVAKGMFGLRTLSTVEARRRIMGTKVRYAYGRSKIEYTEPVSKYFVKVDAEGKSIGYVRVDLLPYIPGRSKRFSTRASRIMKNALPAEAYNPHVYYQYSHLPEEARNLHMVLQETFL